MKQEKWLLCPVCGNKTRLKLREDTILENDIVNIPLHFFFTKSLSCLLQ